MRILDTHIGAFVFSGYDPVNPLDYMNYPPTAEVCVMMKNEFNELELFKIFENKTEGSLFFKVPLSNICTTIKKNTPEKTYSAGKYQGKKLYWIPRYDLEYYENDVIEGTERRSKEEEALEFE